MYTCYTIDVSLSLAFTSVPALLEPKVTYIQYAQSGHTTKAPKFRPRPTPVIFPPPPSHAFEHLPTRTLFLFCRWLQAEDSPMGRAGRKGKSINTGCQECNYALCWECFFVFPDMSIATFLLFFSSHGILHTYTAHEFDIM